MKNYREPESCVEKFSASLVMTSPDKFNLNRGHSDGITGEPYKTKQEQRMKEQLTQKNFWEKELNSKRMKMTSLSATSLSGKLHNYIMRKMSRKIQLLIKFMN